MFGVVIMTPHKNMDINKYHLAHFLWGLVASRSFWIGCNLELFRTPRAWPLEKKASLLRQVPGGEAASRIRCDLAHIWAIGVGKEFIGSALLLLAGELRVWPGRSLGARLDHAYGLFRTWCSNSKQTCKINEFRLRTFKVTSSPSFAWIFFCA